MTETHLMCVQPCIPYYAWQVEVMLHNFISVGITSKGNSIDLLFAYNKNESDWEQKVAVIKKVESRFDSHPLINFYYYEDSRRSPYNYISGVRPNILKQHFRRYPYLSHSKIFYHDCDIVFTRYPSFLERLDVSGMQWYVSDTISYIGYDYIVSKGADVLDKMCQITGCHPMFIKSKQEQAGGCQYLFSNVDWTFFEKMEYDSETLFTQITELNNRKKAIKPDYHELQIWCADMWAMIWGAWMRGFTTIIDPDLNFVWATDPVEKWNEKIIFHNAGVTSEGECFYKGVYQDIMPYVKIDEIMATISPKLASYRYAQIIQDVSKITCLC